MNDNTHETWGVEHVQLTGASRFLFRCHDGLSCWGTCCRSMDIMVAPFDVLRLKRRLGVTSGEFLDRYTETKLHEESSLPIIILRTGEGEERKCPFLGDKGCTVYEDRPAICRYYPIGLATLRAKKEEGITDERFYFRVREEFCLGHHEEREWTVDEWREDQGASVDDEANADWQRAFLSRALPGEEKIDPRRQSLFMMTCYDLDTFRRFVGESAFLENFEVEPETVEKIMEDDEELLRFGMRYMKYFMMIEETMTPRTGAVEKWKVRKSAGSGE